MTQIIKGNKMVIEKQIQKMNDIELVYPFFDINFNNIKIIKIIIKIIINILNFLFHFYKILFKYYLYIN